MDIISGLCKVICHATSASDNGKTVTISNGSNTWTATIANQKAAFLIPSIPVPARAEYTIKLGTANPAEFSKTIQMGYGEVIEVYLDPGYEYVRVNAFEDFQDETVEAIGDINTQLTGAYSGAMIPFVFGVDDQGRYGYKKAGADSVTPFRTGQETLCYKLTATADNARKFDIISACASIKNTYGIDVNYATLTNANFVCQPTSGGDTTLSGSDTGDANYSWTTTGVYTEPSIVYNAVTGILTVSGSTWQGKYYRQGGSGGAPFDAPEKSTDIKAYLIVSMNG